MMHEMAVKTGRLGELRLDPALVLPEPPSHYVHRNVWFGTAVQVGSEALTKLPTRVMWGSDYPHYEGTYPNSTKAIRRAMSGFDPETVQKVLAGNAAALYGFDLEALAPLAAEFGPTVEEVAVPCDEPVGFMGGGMAMAAAGAKGTDGPA